MRLKKYHVTANQIIEWFIKNGTNVYPPMDPFKVVEDLKTGKEWSYLGTPIELKKL